jgi:anti-sigma B factor antagonist
MLNVDTRTAGNCTILDCSGKITVGAGTTALRMAVREAIKGHPKKIVLNLQNVDYADSAGIGELVSSLTHAQSLGGRLVLLSLPVRIKELLIITKLITAFEIQDEEENALADCM